MPLQGVTKLIVENVLKRLQQNVQVKAQIKTSAYLATVCLLSDPHILIIANFSQKVNIFVRILCGEQGAAPPNHVATIALYTT